MKGIVIVMVSLALAVGCQITPTVYHEEVVNQSEGYFQITGSMVDPENILFANELTYVFAIDGRPVKRRKRRYREPIPVPLGAHTIQIGFLQGTLSTQVSFEVNVGEPNLFIARSELINNKDAARISLEDAHTENILEPPVVGKISRNSVIFVPL